jgi:hypothetical protein
MRELDGGLEPWATRAWAGDMVTQHTRQLTMKQMYRYCN